MSEALACPGCGREHAGRGRERFCSACGLPLVRAEGPRETAVVGERQARARKVKPQLAEGELVRVAGARHQAEAEFVQGLLLEEGVPSTLRCARGFDVPDFLAAGPRDVLVPASGAAVAREVLLQSDLEAVVADARAAAPVPGRVLAWLLVAVVVVAAIVALVYAVT